VNFLDLIWLIPLFPLCGAALMLLVGKKLDPQPVSDVAVAPGVEPVADEHGHAHPHAGAAGHTHEHGHPHSPLKFLISLICPGTVLISFLLSAAAVWQLSSLPQKVHQVIQFSWIAGLPFHMANGQMTTLQADWGFLLDPLSAVMILVVTGVGFLIHVYSVGYMAHDNGFYRFFGYLNLFVFLMLMLVVRFHNL